MSLLRSRKPSSREPTRMSLEYATEAGKHSFKAPGRPSGARAGRPGGSFPCGRGPQGRAADGNQAAAEALALCRCCGDLTHREALNMLVFH
jgi:hypothetical protein